MTRPTEVARALLREPKVLLMDEPAAGLTQAEARAFCTLVTEIGRSRLVVIAEHNISVISTVADRVTALIEAQLVADNGPDVVQSNPKVQRVPRPAGNKRVVSTATRQSTDAAPSGLRLEQVHAGYGRVDVLRGCDMTVQPGGSVALVAPNGAGTSSLF